MNRSYTFYNYGNEYQQLLRYLNLIYELKQPSVSIASNLTQKYDISISNYLVSLSSFYTYRYDLYAEEHPNITYSYDNYPSIWYRTIIPMDSGKAVKYAKDCSYHVENNEYSIQYIEKDYNFYLYFLIHQINCQNSLFWQKSSDKAKELFAGGSSFDISWETNHYLTACNSFDHFNYSYSIYCPIKVTRAVMSQLSHSECGNITVKLQYEHYDAFDNKGIQKFILMNEEIISQYICASIVEHNIKSTHSLQPYSILFPITSSSSHYIENIDQQVQLSYHSMIHHLWTTTHSTISSPILSHSETLKYAWNSNGLSYITHEIFYNCTNHHSFLLIGSSHMRYLYDFFYDQYVKPFDLYIHHLDHRIASGKLVYSHKVFGNHVASAIENLSCNEKRIVIIQTLTWDVKYYPISNFITNPNNGPKIIQALHRLKQKSSLCQENLVIVFLTCMPHPLCKDRDCGLGLNYWRNNAAIKAANQYLLEEIIKLGMSNVHVLDVMPIILPRLLKWDNDVLYFNHFLFSGYETTPQGVAMAMELLHSICKDEIQAAVHGIQIKNKTISHNGFESVEELFAIRNIEKNIGIEYRYYRWSYHTGCYREFPDEITIHYFGYQRQQFHRLESNKILNQYKSCHYSIYPSRKNGTMWQIKGEKNVYYLDMLIRRPMNSVNTLISLGLDFDQVVFCAKEEMESLPLGPMLYGKNEVNYLKYEEQTLLSKKID